MSNDTVNVRNTKRGTVGTVRRRIFESPVLNQGVLVEVDANAKPYVPELYRPRDAQTFLAEQASKTKQVETADADEANTETKDAD